MQQFIDNIFQFIFDLFYFVRRYINANAIPIYNINESIASYKDFLESNVFLDNSLIGFNFSWLELFYYIIPIFLVIFFIVLIVRFIWAMLTLIKDSATKWR